MTEYILFDANHRLRFPILSKQTHDFPHGKERGEARESKIVVDRSVVTMLFCATKGLFLNCDASILIAEGLSGRPLV